MRAVKAIALVTALLSLVSMAGAGFMAIQLMNSLAESAETLSGLPQALGQVPVQEMMEYATAYLNEASNTLVDTVREAQMLIIILFCAAVAFLLITMVLLVALRPAARERYNDDYDDDGY